MSTEAHLRWKNQRISLHTHNEEKYSKETEAMEIIVLTKEEEKGKRHMTQDFAKGSTEKKLIGLNLVHGMFYRLLNIPSLWQTLGP